jgi:hypothetical protein
MVPKRSRLAPPLTRLAFARLPLPAGERVGVTSHSRGSLAAWLPLPAGERVGVRGIPDNAHGVKSKRYQSELSCHSREASALT